jgi:5-methylcytosine-specific restriction endonuclease McrA
VAKEFSRKFYASKRWKQCRSTYKQLVNGLCERCLRKGKYNAGEEVHHKIWLTPNNINDPNITLNFDNLELLCASCHTYEHVGKFSPTREGLKFNSNGELVEEG